jgi:hypothetical protein
MPSTGGYLVSPRLIAAMAASLMLSGVSKSGSDRQRNDVPALGLQVAHGGWNLARLALARSCRPSRRCAVHGPRPRLRPRYSGVVIKPLGLAIAEGRLGGDEAGRAAFDIVLIERLNTTHPDTDPSRCA